MADRPKNFITDSARRPSAVLLPLFFKDSEFYILFTKRTEFVSHHKGEISFPGGGYNSDDGTLLNTALRESFEEIGLSRDDVEVLGELDDIITRGSPFIVSPFVGIMPADYPLRTSNFEIAEVITIPVSALLLTGSRTDSFESMDDGQPILASVFAYRHYRIIGATARILKQFLDLYSRL